MVHTSPIITDVISFLESNLSDKKDIKTIIEAGAGMGWLSFWLRMILEQKPYDPEHYRYHIIALEKFGPYAQICKQKGFYNQVYTEDVLAKDLTCDFLVSIEMLEHLPKEEAQKFLWTSIRSCKYIFLTTPNHFFEQNHLHDNPLQEHKCFFTKREFEKLGLRVKNHKGTFFVYSKNLHWFNPSLLQKIRRKIIPIALRKRL